MVTVAMFQPLQRSLLGLQLKPDHKIHPNPVFEADCVSLLHHQIQRDTCDSPFGIQQIADFLVVDLHVGNLNLKSVGLVPLPVDPLKQRAAEPRD